MINVTLATNAERKNVIVAPNTSLAEIIRDNGISIDGANIMLNGTTVSPFDLDRTLAQCNVADGSTAMMSVVVKASAAA